MALLWRSYPVAAMTIEAIAIASLGLAMFWIAGTARLTTQAKDVCKRIAAGDFEARILAIPEHDSAAELLRAVNDMIDGCDAFVREATAAMDAVHHNKYYRRIMPGGLHGALLLGANTINSRHRQHRDPHPAIRAADRRAGRQRRFDRIRAGQWRGGNERNGGKSPQRRVDHARAHHFDRRGIRAGGRQPADGGIGDRNVIFRTRAKWAPISSVPPTSPGARSSAWPKLPAASTC